MDNYSEGYFDDELPDDAVRYESELDDEDVLFEADVELEEELEQPSAELGSGLRERGRQAFNRAADAGRERVYDAADRGKGRLADAIEHAADRLDGGLSQTAEYLRSHDVEVIRNDFVQQVRRHPLLSVGIAVGTGYLVGKALGVGGSQRGVRGRIRGTANRQLRRALLSGVTALIAARANDTGRDREY